MRRLMLEIIAGYQKWLSPWLGGSCRFVPSCSEYAQLAIGKYGTIRGIWFTLKRLARCHPWYSGPWQDPLV